LLIVFNQVFISAQGILMLISGAILLFTFDNRGIKVKLLFVNSKKYLKLTVCRDTV